MNTVVAQSETAENNGQAPTTPLPTVEIRTLVQALYAGTDERNKSADAEFAAALNDGWGIQDISVTAQRIGTDSQYTRIVTLMQVEFAEPEITAAAAVEALVTIGEHEHAKAQPDTETAELPKVDTPPDPPFTVPEVVPLTARKSVAPEQVGDGLYEAAQRTPADEITFAEGLASTSPGAIPYTADEIIAAGDRESAARNQLRRGVLEMQRRQQQTAQRYATIQRLGAPFMPTGDDA